MKKILSSILVYYEYAVGLKTDADDLLISSRIKLFKKVGSKIQERQRKKRLSIIEATSPLVSIIIPCFNAVSFIDKAIESILNQSYKHWELLVIDDGSNDGSIEIVKEFASKNSRIMVFSNRNNRGVSYSRNVGLYHASGEFITFHDADDISHPQRIEYLLFELLNNNKKQIVVSKYIRVNEEQKHLIVNTKKKLNHISGMMFRKKVIKKLGFFKETNISEDSEYHERILAVYGKKCKKLLQRVLYYANFSTNSLLFSNADIKVKGVRVDYTIKNKSSLILEDFRNDHLKIKNGNLAPYQGFEIDKEITYINK